MKIVNRIIEEAEDKINEIIWQLEQDIGLEVDEIIYNRKTIPGKGIDYYPEVEFIFVKKRY